MEKTTAQRDGNHSAAVRATYGCDVHSSFKKEKTEIAIRKKKKKILNREKGDVPPEHLHFPFASEVSS